MTFDFMKDLIFQGRIAITGPRNKKGLNQYAIGGVLIGHKDMPVTKNDGWEMIECEVIIRPTKIHRKIKDSWAGARLDQVALLVKDGRQWSQREYPEPDMLDELMK